jgi:hypothetical protein
MLTFAPQEGAVPVFVCFSDCHDAIDILPFSEYVDYSKASLSIAVARITELHFLLRSIPDSDLHFMQRQGGQKHRIQEISSLV